MDAPANGTPAEAPQDAATPDLPLFEVIVPSSIIASVNPIPPKYHFKIWGDGRLEGFESLGAIGLVVLNRVPNMIATLAAPMGEYVNQMNDLAKAIAEQAKLDAEQRLEG